MAVTPVAHITTRAAWAGALAAGEYTAPSLRTQGFIHASRPDGQLLRVADFLYRGQPDLVVLLIAPERLRAELRWEEFEPGSDLFPHLYGSLSLDAVVEVLDFPPEPDGTFRLPGPLRRP
ncbi:DUF952 domain-containing protein [Deinococcus petrolearius]|uniref:DUF952 domain-containing protein n=1 Tax=Deinococcus petrolearius TaxID=1751295 RepID=A0ABW1DLY8_9DEIO